MNNINIKQIQSDLINKFNSSIPKDAGSILWQLLNAVEALQENQNKLLERIQELEYSANRLSSNECDCSVCRGNYE